MVERQPGLVLQSASGKVKRRCARGGVRCAASKVAPGHAAAGGAAPKPSWSPKVADADDPFSSIGPSFKPKA